MKGNFLDGVIHGPVIQKTREGDIYKGNFENNERNGYG